MTEEGWTWWSTGRLLLVQRFAAMPHWCLHCTETDWHTQALQRKTGLRSKLLGDAKNGGTQSYWKVDLQPW